MTETSTETNQLTFADLSEGDYFKQSNVKNAPVLKKTRNHITEEWEGLEQPGVVHTISGDTRVRRADKPLNQRRARLNRKKEDT